MGKFFSKLGNLVKWTLIVLLAGSILLVLCYALGYSAVLVGAGTFAQIFSEFIDSDRESLTYWAVKAVNVMCGIALIVGGIYLVSEVRF